MDFTFTTQDAQIVYGILASAFVPLIVGWLSRSTWPSWARFALAAVVSLLMAALSQYAAGALSTGSFIVALAGVFTVSQAFFASWFKGLGFERWLNPEMQAPETEFERNVRLYALLHPNDKAQQAMADLGASSPQERDDFGWLNIDPQWKMPEGAADAVRDEVLKHVEATSPPESWPDYLVQWRARENRPKAEDDAEK